MWVEVQAKGHGTETRSRQKAQAKETKEMRRNVGSRGGTGDYLWTGKAAMGCAGTLSPIKGAPNPDAQTPAGKLHKVLYK